MVLGIESTAVWLAYLLCLMTALLCVIWGVITWNRGTKEVKEEERIWLEEEKEIGV